MTKKYNIIKTYGIGDEIKQNYNDGMSFQNIVENINSKLPEGEDKITIRKIEYFIEKEKDSNKASITQDSVLLKLNLIEDEIWDLIDEVKNLRKIAKKQVYKNPLLYDKTIRTSNMILQSAISLVKELKAPAESLKIDVKKQSLQILLEFGNSLPPEKKDEISSLIGNFIDNGDHDKESNDQSM